ncbi:hypothetical protein [Geodermatophilus sp. SYSU D01105]
MASPDADMTTLLELAAGGHSTALLIEGYVVDDRNLPGNVVVAQSPQLLYSVGKADVEHQEGAGDGRVRLRIRPGAQAFRIEPFLVGDSYPPSTDPQSPFGVGMEHIVPPPSAEFRRAPGLGNDLTDTVELAAAPTLESVGARWTDSCAGGDRYANNCAHFLSDAFIRAGFAELAAPNPHIHARCGTSARRPIRARNLWSWFQSKATRTSRTLQRNTGWWAAFQLDERVYWGGHVAVWDSDADQPYGTGWYPHWNQYLYQW